MTSQQRNFSIWFAVLTVLIALLSIITSNKIKSADLSNLTKALDEAAKVINPVNSSPSPTLVTTTPTALPDSASTLSDISSVPAVRGATQSATVARVVDGDTIVLDTGQKVRYIGIDTPELHHPQKGVECFGLEAYERNKTLLEGKVVELEKDVNETDRYGRLLRYVWLDGTLVNKSLVEEGYAFSSSYPPDIKYQKIFDLAETLARESNKGLWERCPTLQELNLL